ncbi:MAG: cytochrome c [Hyphomicrobiaceae bacterium]|jgi:cytochrome c
MRIVLGRLACGKRCRACLFSVAFALISFAGTAMAKDQLQLARGEAIARSKCGVCHAIGKSDSSPTRINVDTSFRDLYLRFPIPMLVKAAKTGYITGHDEMPGFGLSPSEISALLLYMDSMSPEGAPRYISKKR